MNLALATLAFLGGVSSFLSPCAFPLLPVYITRWIDEGWMKKSLVDGLKTGLIFVLGIESTLIIFLLLPVFLIKRIISLIPIVGIILGASLLLFGLIALSGKNIRPIQIWFKGLGRMKNLSIEQFFYGLIYAFNSLTCSLPILFMILSASLVTGEALILFVIFSTGMVAPMFLLVVFSSFIGNILMNKLKIILPYIGKIEALIVITVGFYLIFINL